MTTVNMFKGFKFQRSNSLVDDKRLKDLSN